MTKKNITHIEATDYITVYLEGGVARTIAATDKRFKAVKKAIKDKDMAGLIAILDVATGIKTISNGKVTVKDGRVYYQGKELHNAITKRIIKMVKEGYDATPMIKFLQNVMTNPSQKSAQELYLFLEANELPITDDGCFLAYKAINENWTDCYTGKIDNSVGKVVKMSRGNVDDNRDSTCSHGLHFCSKEYLNHFHGARHVVLKINPRDVVSIPSDYNNAKGRCCEYLVLEEVTDVFDGNFSEDVYKAPVVNTQKRDKSGRFTSGKKVTDKKVSEVGKSFDFKDVKYRGKYIIYIPKTKSYLINLELEKSKDKHRAYRFTGRWIQGHTYPAACGSVLSNPVNCYEISKLKFIRVK